MITFKIHSFTQSVCLQIMFPASVSLGHITNLMNGVLDPSWSLKSCNLKPQYNTTCPVWLTECYEDQTEKENIYSSALFDEGNATVGEGVWGRRLTFIMLFALSFLIALPDQFSTFLHPDLQGWPTPRDCDNWALLPSGDWAREEERGWGYCLSCRPQAGWPRSSWKATAPRGLSRSPLQEEP